MKATPLIVTACCAGLLFGIGMSTRLASTSAKRAARGNSEETVSHESRPETLRTAVHVSTPATVAVPPEITMNSLPGVLDQLLAAGLESDVAAAAAVSMLEKRMGQLSSQDRLTAELTVEEALLARGFEVPLKDWDSELKSLADEGRRTEVKTALGTFDSQMRKLQWKQARGEIDSLEYYQSWEKLKTERQTALMAHLTPEEGRRWIVSASEEAKALSLLKIEGLPSNLIDQVAVIKYEAARALEKPTLTDAERGRIADSMSDELKTVLGEEKYTKLVRAEDPRYEAYRDLTKSIGLSAQSADAVFEWQKHVYQRERELRAQGMSEDDLMREMQKVAGEAAEALRVGIPAEQMAAFMTLPQSMFLSAYEPLEHFPE